MAHGALLLRATLLLGKISAAIISMAKISRRASVAARAGGENKHRGNIFNVAAASGNNHLNNNRKLAGGAVSVGVAWQRENHGGSQRAAIMAGGKGENNGIEAMALSNVNVKIGIARHRGLLALLAQRWRISRSSRSAHRSRHLCIAPYAPLRRGARHASIASASEENKYRRQPMAASIEENEKWRGIGIGSEIIENNGEEIS
jgi:hypothetical protein